MVGISFSLIKMYEEIVNGVENVENVSEKWLRFAIKNLKISESQIISLWSEGYFVPDLSGLFVLNLIYNLMLTIFFNVTPYKY